MLPTSRAMNSKLISHLLAAVGLSFATAVTATPAEDKAMEEASSLFDFSDLDVVSDPAEPPKEAPPPVPDDPLPATVREVLQKWDRFQDFKENARRTQVKALREVASEILFKRAADADAKARPALIEEAKRIAALDAGEPVVTTDAPVAGSGLVGIWGVKGGKHGWRYTEDGKLITGEADAVWSWVDEKNGIALAIWQGKYPLLIWQKGDRYDAIDLYAAPGPRHRVKTTASPAPAAAAAAPVLTKLATDENALTASRDKLFAEKRTRIAAFLRAQVKDAKGPAVAAIMEKSAALEAVASLPAGGLRANAHGADRISGKWEWPDGKKATFAPDGTATVEGLGTGRWRAGNDGASAVAVVLCDKSGRVTAQNQLLLGRFSVSNPTTVHLRDISGKKYDIRKTGPPSRQTHLVC